VSGPVTDDHGVVHAAGGVVWRPATGGAVEILVVHRPKYDDWTLPKGKLEPGETHEQAAVREVEEETGLRCELGPELPATSYTDHQGRPKAVRYWSMQIRGGAFAPTVEVDEVRWVPVDAAASALTYAHDRAVVDALPR
jgi:8-oxo-dGTP diphosphatase